ncbi:MAG TPA: BrnA antitoxin family protein [Burkholderiales bacterium]
MAKAFNSALVEEWESDTPDAEEEFMKVADEAATRAADDAAVTQLVSIRMSKSMIEAFKALSASLNGIGYQTLMKQILQRFIESEMKRVWKEHLAQQLSAQVEAASEDAEAPRQRKRKAA